MLFRQGALSRNGRRNRRIQPFRDRSQLAPGTGDYYAAAADEERLSGRQDGRRRRFNRFGIGPRTPGRISRMFRLRPDVVRVHRDVLLRVEWEAQMSGAGLACSHRAKSRAHCLGHPIGAIQHCVPFRQRTEQAFLIELRQGIAPARSRADVSGNTEYGNRAFVRLDDAGQNVGRATTARPFADADLATDTGIGIRHVGRGALVARQICAAFHDRQSRVRRKAAGWCLRTNRKCASHRVIAACAPSLLHR